MRCILGFLVLFSTVISQASLNDLAAEIAAAPMLTKEAICHKTKILDAVDSTKVSISTEDVKSDMKVDFYVTFFFESNLVLRCLFDQKIKFLNADQIVKARKSFVSQMQGRLKAAKSQERLVNLYGAYLCEDSDFVQVTQYHINDKDMLYDPFK